MSSLKAYAVTITVVGKRGLTKYIHESDIRWELDSIWSDILTLTKPITSDYIYETAEKSTKLHLHGMLSTYHKFTYKSLQRIGCQIYIRELRSPEEETNWFYYVNKDKYLFEDEQVHTLPTVAE